MNFHLSVKVGIKMFACFGFCEMIIFGSGDTMIPKAVSHISFQ